MRNSYIANSHEAAALHSGKQTAVVVKMKVQPKKIYADYYDIDIRNGKYGYYNKGALIHNVVKDLLFIRCAPYQLGQEVYVREKWGKIDMSDSDDFSDLCYVHFSDEDSISLIDVPGYGDCFLGWQSPATMPQSAARTRFKVVGVDVERVRDVPKSKWIDLIGYIINNNSEVLYCNYPDDVSWFDNSEDSYKSYIIAKIGQQAWDENHYVWFLKIEKC
jgi:hypothetical protein